MGLLGLLEKYWLVLLLDELLLRINFVFILFDHFNCYYLLSL